MSVFDLFLSLRPSPFTGITVAVSFEGYSSYVLGHFAQSFPGLAEKESNENHWKPNNKPQSLGPEKC